MSDKLKPSYQGWLDRMPDFARRTPQGTVMCFKINVNRDGHGYISHMTDKGAVDPTPLRGYGIEEAVKALRDAWAQAEALANQPQGAETTGND